MARVHEALLDRVREELEERREESARVHHHDGIQIQPEALERDRFQQLLERAGAAGQGDRGLTQGQHHVFAGAQVLDQLQVAQPLVTPLEIGHEARQDADHASALAECAIGERAHGAGRAATIDDSNTLACEHLAQAPCGGPILGVGGAARRAVHAHGPLDGLLGCFGHRFRRVVLAIPRL